MINVPHGIDINQLGASDAPRFSIFQTKAYLDAIVEDVIVNNDHPLYSATGRNVGQIQIRIVDLDKLVPSTALHWANPIDSNIQEYPLKNEIVMVFASLGQLYYTRKIGISRKPTENSWKELSLTVKGSSSTEKTIDVRTASAQGKLSPEVDSRLLGRQFIENPNVKPLKHFEGDIILQGRFGNSIRLGSNYSETTQVQIGRPNILFSIGRDKNQTSVDTEVGLVLENINQDESSIWMVSDQTVPFIASTALSVNTNPSHLRSATTRTSTYSGNQIFISSGRLVLNSKNEEISLFSAKEINLSSLGHATIDSEKSVYISANSGVSITSLSHMLLVAKDLGVSAPMIEIQSKAIKLAGTHPTVLGDRLVELLTNLITQLNSPTAIVTSTGFASLSPSVRASLDTIRGKLNSIKSTTVTIA